MKSKILLLSLLCAFPCVSYCAPSFADFKNHFAKYEGVRNNIYKCSRGFITVGLGHKFEKGEKIKSYYSDAEINNFFAQDLKEAKVVAQRVFPNFNSHSNEVQILLVSLCFNMGEGGINKFVKFKKAVAVKNYKAAAKELKNSLWFSQVGNRGNHYVQLLNNV